MVDRKTVAVFFGGRSPEHDVSVVTALQVMGALDAESYEILPVYLATDGTWWTGDILLQRETYLPTAEQFAQLIQVTLDLTASGRPRLIAVKGSLTSSLFGRSTDFPFDVALPSFHGLVGEDGQIQGTFEAAGIPYTGMRTMASAILMDKVATKRLLAGTDVPVLSYREIRRPSEGLLITEDELAQQTDGFAGPWCVKPSHLGSSIGVARAESLQELSDVLAEIFRYDSAAILEPFVDNMVEYNVAVSKFGGRIRTSAIERPKRTSELLDFKEKYLSGGGKKAGGSKAPGQASSEGMLSLTRELNPQLPQGLEGQIRGWAEIAFDSVAGTGAPRIDFIGNDKTGEVWLNEVNPCPGSFGYFLWEAAREEPLLFSDLLDHLLREAFEEVARARLPTDPTPKDARLFERRG